MNTVDVQHHPLIQSFLTVAPLLNDLLQDDVTIGVFDTEKMLLHVPAKTFSLNAKPGDPLKDEDVVTLAIRDGQPKADFLPKEVFGFPLVAKGIPLFDENHNVIGGVGIGTSLENINQIYEVSESLSAIVEQTSATINEVADSINHLADRVTESVSKVREVEEGAKEIVEISASVRGISEQSNMLGLNAAIEAARAGEAGRGFSVVADEIRKLANSSKENVGQVDGITMKIQSMIKDLTQSFEQINHISETQAAAIEQISATVEEISSNAEQLTKMVKARISQE
ncbi:methyl-accepting chemotaxis protein [Bacillus xiapuensis]|uniref:methyl-accepting chemotaxis protein n=1 Tax=Bacillus xiapuensis TaxID=2014075 RepID=UPI000C241C39|nr:methyl-accepting chemotaxis protein [Bacillus xiapuensis]